MSCIYRGRVALCYLTIFDWALERPLHHPAHITVLNSSLQWGDIMSISSDTVHSNCSKWLGLMEGNLRGEPTSKAEVRS